MITKEIILRLHHLSVAKYGGAKGMRDEGLLESAVARPYQTFGGVDLYPAAHEKAAAIMESLITDHPFVDGNKRTGFLGMFAIFTKENIKLTATDNVIYKFTIMVSTGEIKFDDMVIWLKENSISV
jgi:death-on-curing protein